MGGTGAIGLSLVRQLSKLDRKFEIFVTSRQHILSEREGVQYLKGNAKDIAFLKSFLALEPDIIVDFMNYSTKEFKERYYMLLMAKVQYIYLSSSRVYAENNDKITESSSRLLDISCDQSFLASDEYALAKAHQEDLLRTSGKQNWTIIRPYITYNNNRLQLGVLEKEGWLYRLLQGRIVVFPEEMLKKQTTLTYAEDVAEAIIKLIANSNALCEYFHITQNDTITWGDVLKIYTDVIEEKTGLTPKIKFISMDDFAKCNDGKYQIIYDRMYDRKFNNSKIEKYINVEGFMSTKIGLRSMLQEFLQQPNFGNINWKSEAKKDKLTSEFTSLESVKGIKNKIKYLLYRLG